MQDIFITLISSGCFASLLTYVFTRKRERAAAQKSELENIQQAVTIWRELAESLTMKIEKLETKICSLEAELKRH